MQSEAGVLFFQLEGKLAGPWVKELERCWRCRHATELPRARGSVCSTFIDGGGKALLGQMYKEGTELVASGCLNKCIVEEVEMNKPTYEELKQDLIKHPNRMVFIKDFGPALFQEEVKTPKYQQLVFKKLL